MALTIPNEGSATYSDQAEPDSVDFDIIVAALARSGVISGCAVTQRGAGANMSVDVAAGVVLVAGARASVVAVNKTIGAADATNPRFDLITVNSSGTVAVTAGTAASNAVFPAIPATSVVLAAVYVPANATSVVTAQIVDKRVILGVSGTLFGDGSDGAVTIASGTTTLTRDMYYDTLVVSGGATLKPAGFKVFCRTSAQIDGTLDASGTNGAASSGSSGGGGGAGGGADNGSVGFGSSGGVGSVSGAGGGAGNFGAFPNASLSSSTNSGGTGGTGTSGAGGVGVTQRIMLGSQFLIAVQAAVAAGWSNAGVWAKVSGGSGGGGGGGDATNRGGGGGGGGGVVVLVALTITGSGTITAKGGNGGNAGSGNTGGGGAANGGSVVVVTKDSSGFSGTITVAAGSVGTGIGTGTNGGAGTAGGSVTVQVT